MTGLVLCGGNSSRMGSDKGLLAASGITWCETALHKLTPFVASVAVSVNARQMDIYQKHFPEVSLVRDKENLSIGGPLRGLLSTHMEMPETDILLFACDLLYMEPVVLQELLRLQQASPAYNAYVFRQEQEAEPLCGIYTATGLANTLAAYHAGTLGKQSMKHVLETGNTLYTPLPIAWRPYFRNINTRTELT